MSAPRPQPFWLRRDAGRVLDALEPSPKPFVPPTLIVLSGLPGVGKSTFARKLASLAPLVIVASDEVRKLLIKQPKYTETEHARVFRVLYAVVGALLRRGSSVILDATNIEDRIRSQAYRIAQDTGARLVVVSVEAPAEVVRQRLDARTSTRSPGDLSDATWEVYLKMAPLAQPIRRSHIVVDTTQDTDAAAEEIAAVLRSGVGTEASVL